MPVFQTEKRGIFSWYENVLWSIYTLWDYKHYFNNFCSRFQYNSAIGADQTGQRNVQGISTSQLWKIFPIGRWSSLICYLWIESIVINVNHCMQSSGEKWPMWTDQCGHHDFHCGSEKYSVFLSRINQKGPKATQLLDLVKL